MSMSDYTRKHSVIHKLINQHFVNSQGSGILQKCCPRLSEEYSDYLEIQQKIKRLPAPNKKPVTSFNSCQKLSRIPDEILFHIFSFSEKQDVANFSQTNSFYYKIISNNQEYWSKFTTLRNFETTNLPKEWLRDLSPKTVCAVSKIAASKHVSSRTTATIKQNYGTAATVLRVLKFVASLLFLFTTITWTLHMDDYITGYLVPLLVGVPMVLLGVAVGVLVCGIAAPSLCWSLHTYRDVCITTAGYWTSWLYVFRYNSRAGQILAVSLCSCVPTLLGIGYLIPWYLYPNTFKTASGLHYHPMTWFLIAAIILLMVVTIPIVCCCFFDWMFVRYIASCCTVPAIICSVPFCIAFIMRLGLGEFPRGYFLWSYVLILALLPLLLAAISVCLQTLCLDWKNSNDPFLPIFCTKLCCKWSVPSAILFSLLFAFMITFCVTFDVTRWDEAKGARVRYIPVVVGFSPLLAIQTLLVAFYFCKMLKLIPEQSNKFPCTLWAPPALSTDMILSVV